MVEERVIGLIKALSWHNLRFKKFDLDLWMYFHMALEVLSGIEDYLWKSSKWLKRG